MAELAEEGDLKKEQFTIGVIAIIVGMTNHERFPMVSPKWFWLSRHLLPRNVCIGAVHEERSRYCTGDVSNDDEICEERIFR